MSKLSAIGFVVSSEDAFLRTVGTALNRAAPPADLGTAAARYLWLVDASGAALAARIDQPEVGRPFRYNHLPMRNNPNTGA